MADAKAEQNGGASSHLSTCIVKPEYPQDSYNNHEDGQVVLAYLVSTTGKVVQTKIEKSSGYSALDEATLRISYTDCKFDPDTRDGKPVESWRTMKIGWHLDDAAPADAGFVKGAIDRCTKKPDYPSAARRRDEEGLVIMSFLVDADGSVMSSKIAQSSGSKLLDYQALTVLTQSCHFHPAMENGNAVRSWVEVRYTWRLE